MLPTSDSYWALFINETDLHLNPPRHIPMSMKSLRNSWSTGLSYVSVLTHVTLSGEQSELLAAEHWFGVIFNVIIKTEWAPWREVTHFLLASEQMLSLPVCVREREMECCNAVNALISEDAYQAKDVWVRKRETESKVTLAASAPIPSEAKKKKKNNPLLNSPLIELNITFKCRADNWYTAAAVVEGRSSSQSGCHGKNTFTA